MSMSEKADRSLGPITYAPSDLAMHTVYEKYGRCLTIITLIFLAIPGFVRGLPIV